MVNIPLCSFPFPLNVLSKKWCKQLEAKWTLLGNMSYGNLVMVSNFEKNIILFWPLAVEIALILTLVVGQISLSFVDQKVLPTCAKSVFSNEGGFIHDCQRISIPSDKENISKFIKQNNGIKLGSKL